MVMSLWKPVPHSGRHRMRGGPPFQDCACVPSGDLRHAPTGVESGAAHVRGEDQAFPEGQQTRMYVRLVLEDIQAGPPDLPVLQGFGQGMLVDERPARSV